MPRFQARLTVVDGAVTVRYLVTVKANSEAEARAALREVLQDKYYGCSKEQADQAQIRRCEI